ncbi:MAG: 50S ribosomal protein L10 [Oscillospiraceae bacterium]|nr:50S ribosomal protein L10 [Oscillospiraceae bacterium]
MASEKILAGKKSYVEGVKELLDASMGGVVFDYKGITVEEDTKLRKELREAGVHYEVIKNTMLKIAIRGTAIEGLSDALKGSTAVAIANNEDPLAAARILNKFSEASKGKYEIKGGYLDGEVLDVEGVKKIANLPNREGLLSMLLSALQGNLSGLARVINAVKEQKEGEAA